jgi:hypothetical protein
MQVEWMNKVWCPLNIYFPHGSDEQAVASGAAWMDGHPGVSFLLAF